MGMLRIVLDAFMTVRRLALLATAHFSTKKVAVQYIKTYGTQNAQ